MPQTYSPAIAAERLGVHPNSVRQMCASWAALLSEGANPTSGQARRLTSQDVATLQVIIDCRKAGMTRQEIVTELAAPPTASIQAPYIDALQPATPTPSPPSPYIDPPAVSIAVTDPPSSLQAATGADLAGVVALLADVLRERDERLIGRIEATERRGAGLLLGVAVIVMIAFAAGGLAVLVLLRLAG